MARVEDRELLYKYAIWILRKEDLKALFDRGYLYDVDFEDVDKNIAKLENLILRRMSRSTKAKAINKGCTMVKIDHEKLLHRYKRAVISQDKMHKLAFNLAFNGYGFDEKIKNVDKEVEDLEAQLLERLRRDERRAEANDGFELLYTFGTCIDVH